MFKKYNQEILTNDMLNNWFPSQGCFIIYNYDNNKLQYGGELSFATKSTYGVLSHSRQQADKKLAQDFKKAIDSDVRWSEKYELVAYLYLNAYSETPKYLQILNDSTRNQKKSTQGGTIIDGQLISNPQLTPVQSGTVGKNGGDFTPATVHKLIVRDKKTGRIIRPNNIYIGTSTPTLTRSEMESCLKLGALLNGYRGLLIQTAIPQK